MKSYFVSCIVRYTVISDWHGVGYSEFYESIIQAPSKKLAEKYMKEQSLQIFNKDTNEEFENVNVEIDECYETSDDARSN